MTDRATFLCTLLAGTLLLTACGGSNESTEPELTSGVLSALPADLDTKQPTDSTTSPAPEPKYEPKAIALTAAEDETAKDNEQPSAGILAVRAIPIPSSATVAAAAAAPLASVYVATTGNDQWSGSLPAANSSGTDGPVRTIAAAQKIARAQIALMGTARIPLSVIIGAGEYELTAPLAFEVADSGTATAPVTYSAAVPGTVTISGGVRLAQRTLASTSTPATFDNKPAAGTNWNGGGQLYVNDARATLARHPNVGSYWFVTKPVPLAGEPTATQGSQAFGVDATAQSWLGALSTAERDRAIINVMHSWTASHHRFANIAVPPNTVAVSPKSSWPFLKFGGSQRYFIENVPSAFDSAGEFLWDSTGVRYLAKSGQTGVSLQATMPVLEKLVTIRGSMGNLQWAQHLHFRGLTFAHTRSLTPAGGENDSQAAISVSAAIEVDSAKNIVFDNCTIKHTGGYGLWLRSAVVDSSVTNSVLTDLGAGGIKIGAPAQAATDALITGRNTVSGNSISESGKIYPGAVGVLVGRSFDNVVANNAIFNTTYTGISVGWTWGYGADHSGRNKVTDNLLFNIGSGQLSDLGAIYTLGISPGTVVSGNVIRQVRGYTGYGPGAWGLFSDEGTSNVTYLDNVVVGTDSGSYHLNFGRDNVLQSNLFSLGDKAEIQVSVTDPTRTRLAVTGNTLVPLAAVPFFKFAQSPDAIFNGNTVSSTRATGTLDISKCGTGCVKSTVDIAETTTPRGITVVGDATLAAKYAAIVAKAGPTVVPITGTVAVNAKPDVPVAPVLAFDYATDAAAIGTQPMGLQYSPKGDLTAAVIASDSTAPGGRCLRLNEDPSRPYAYDPYVVALLKHEQGTTVGEFSLKIDTNTNFVHEWRDNNSPYKVGPSITVTRSGVWAGGKVVAPVTVGQWTTIKITAPLAGSGTTWSMDVRSASGTTTAVRNLAFGTAGWGKLHWLGFVSYAKVSSSLCLANIKATTTTQ